MKEITESQQRCLDAVKELTVKGIPPNLSDLGRYLNQAPHSCKQTLLRLERAGAVELIRRDGKIITRGILIL